MTAMTAQIPKGEIVETADQRVLMNGISWEHYELMLGMRGTRRAPRMAYLDGVLELMSASEDHERIKDCVARLVEVYMLEAGMDFGGYGSYTMKQHAELAGAEADQCYRIGVDQTKGRAPDLAIEVVWTHGGIDKLEIYRRLGVREVWFWEGRAISVHVLVGAHHEGREGSAVVPGVDLGLLAGYVDEPLTSTAIRDYREALHHQRS
ncbi:Uma2 family endonuclease [soil metagenome]